MKSFTQDQKIAMLAVPVLLFGVMGISYTSAYARNITDEEKDTATEATDLRTEGNYRGMRRASNETGMGRMHEVLDESGRDDVALKRETIRAAVERNDYDAFLKATKDTPFGQEATREMFDVLVEAHAQHGAKSHHM